MIFNRIIFDPTCLPFSVAALQFLASMPFDAISTDAAWTVLGSLLHTPEDSSGNHKQSSRLKCINGDVTSPEEMIYLITALSNMAISRSSDDRQFITYVAACLLEVGCVDNFYLRQKIF